jgi:Ca2+-binding RTX toxin-like protein
MWPAAAGTTATCRGQAATLVGTPGGTVTGTGGPDVIVTQGAWKVNALGGNDLICVTTTEFSQVDAGDGDDLVDGTTDADGEPLWVRLGLGDDTYEGGDRDDVVNLGGGSSGTDTVHTRGGDDELSTGDPLSTEDDELSLGGGDDTVTAHGPLTNPIDAGPGRDTLVINFGVEEGAAWTLDNRAQVAERDGETVLTWDSFQTFDVPQLGSTDLTFLGGAASERVITVHYRNTRKSDGNVTADLGGGNDSILVTGNQDFELDGGPGRNRFELRGGRSTTHSLVVDLQQGTVHLPGVPDSLLSRFQDARVTRFGSKIEVRGTAGTNRVLLYGCAGTARGRAGDDLLRTRTDLRLCVDLDSHTGITAYGDGGDDRLRGDVNNDHLFGGPGRDRAVGGGGTDECVAEKRIGCERH